VHRGRQIKTCPLLKNGREPNVECPNKEQKTSKRTRGGLKKESEKCRDNWNKQTPSPLQESERKKKVTVGPGGREKGTSEERSETMGDGTPFEKTKEV